jgi:hypothetical protein
VDKLFCYGGILEKSYTDKTTYKSVYGWRWSADEESALGSVVMAIQKEWPDWSIGKIEVSHIPEATQVHARASSSVRIELDAARVKALREERGCALLEASNIIWDAQLREELARAETVEDLKPVIDGMFRFKS